MSAACKIHVYSSIILKDTVWIADFGWVWSLSYNFQSNIVPTKPQSLVKKVTALKRAHSNLSNNMFLFTNDWRLPSELQAQRWPFLPLKRLGDAVFNKVVLGVSLYYNNGLWDSPDIFSCAKDSATETTLSSK